VADGDAAIEVAGVQVSGGPAAIAASLGTVFASVLPATGGPVGLIGFGLLGLAGLGVALRRGGRKTH
jgi:hypothetical protein